MLICNSKCSLIVVHALVKVTKEFIFNSCIMIGCCHYLDELSLQFDVYISMQCVFIGFIHVLNGFLHIREGNIMSIHLLSQHLLSHPGIYRAYVHKSTCKLFILLVWINPGHFLFNLQDQLQILNGLITFTNSINKLGT